MFLLFKNPVVTVAWLDFDHAKSHSKKWPKITPNEIFSRKTSNKTFMYLLPTFIEQNLKKILIAGPEL